MNSYSSGMPRQTTRLPRSSGLKLSESFRWCCFSMTKITSAHSTSSTESGLSAPRLVPADAVAYLDDAYMKVDSHYATLAAWAKSMQDAHAMTASFFASKAWEDYFVHGIAPEGTVDWPRATVVELLREATTAHAKDGWTNLADAIKCIGALHPDQTPKL